MACSALTTLSADALEKLITTHITAKGFLRATAITVRQRQAQASAMIVYRPSNAVTISAQFSHSKYLYQIPGPLTDSMFYADPRQSTRARNYYSPDIYIP